MVAREEGRRQKEIRLRDINSGDRVLIDEGPEWRWEMVRDVSGEYVSTEQRPEGYRMDAIARHEPTLPGPSSPSVWMSIVDDDAAAAIARHP